MAAFGHDIEWVSQRLFIPASLIAFVSGVWLVVDSDFYGFGDDWIVIGLLLYATTFLAGSSLPRAGVGAGREAGGRGLARGASADH